MAGIEERLDRERATAVRQALLAGKLNSTLAPRILDSRLAKFWPAQLEEVTTTYSPENDIYSIQATGFDDMGEKSVFVSMNGAGVLKICGEDTCYEGRAPKAKGIRQFLREALIYPHRPVRMETLSYDD